MMMIAQPWLAFDWWEYAGKPWQLRLVIGVFFVAVLLWLCFLLLVARMPIQMISVSTICYLCWSSSLSIISTESRVQQWSSFCGFSYDCGWLKFTKRTKFLSKVAGPACLAPENDVLFKSNWRLLIWSTLSVLKDLRDMCAVFSGLQAGSRTFKLGISPSFIQCSCVMEERSDRWVVRFWE